MYIYCILYTIKFTKKYIFKYIYIYNIFNNLFILKIIQKNVFDRFKFGKTAIRRCKIITEISVHASDVRLNM